MSEETRAAGGGEVTGEGTGRSGMPDQVVSPDRDAIARKEQAENFPVALRLLPRQARADLAAFYTFARYVDDLGDEYGGDRIAALNEVDADLARLSSGATPLLEPVRGLLRITGDGRVPIEPFHDLVAANLMDQHKLRYATFAELVQYCKLSADPVGRVVLYLAGQADEQNIADSDAVCTGLQVIEHLQDVGEDLRAGRIYLPREDLTAFGVSEPDLARGHADEDVRALLRWEAGRAAVLLSRGVPLARRLRGWARPAVTGYVAGGRATLTALRRADYDVLAATPKPTTGATLRAAAGVFLGRRR
ncbi:squalene synthase HpnC [Actinocrinis puniceicyclus]|uniref:Squalene synthase HpnC n=1 Tax=Actinocrinis puniceicyclus TaxID=977794 RepID=A0A8J8BBC7_9ACTN|nr:squalene synthase HpnC [Actinocrinis puniceicyclus]MBS2962993.1 squalene synthase HpnC [Actinocrinis puniceicyclus]